MSTNMLSRGDTNIHMAGGLDALPEPLDLTAISRAMNGQKSTSEGLPDGASMTHSAGRNHVASERKFGSFWDHASQGIMLANIYNTRDVITAGSMNDEEFTTVPATLHPLGPAFRCLRLMPGCKPQDRVSETGELTPAYMGCIQDACNQATFASRQIKRGGYLNPKIGTFAADDWLLFRIGSSKNEPDDKKLIHKVINFHKFVIEAEAIALARRIDRHMVLGIEKLRKYPANVSDIHIPPMTRADGSVYELEQYITDHMDARGEQMDEYVPDIARDSMQKHLVIAVLPTPTLLNCVDDSKYLREVNSSSPLGKGEYDEAILIRPTRAFPTPAKAREFKDNFAKHAMPEATFHIVSMDERVPILPLYTEWAKKVIPQTYHKHVSQVAMVDMPEAATVKRQLAEMQGIELAHLGPEQTQEEANLQLDKLHRMSRAQERIAKTNAMVAKLNDLRAKKESGGKKSLAVILESGGGSKD
jgi:hypothetical protein